MRPLLTLATFLALWQLLYWFVGDLAFRSPFDVAAQIYGMLTDPKFAPHAHASFLALAQAFSLACVIGLFGGITLGLSRLAAVTAEPILASLYSIPKVVLYPVVILFFGIGMPAKVAFGVINGLIPIMLFTMTTVQNISPTYLRTARVLKLTAGQTLRKVIIPAALPEIITSIRMGFALCVIGVLLGELFSAHYGIGYLLLQAMQLHNVGRVMAITIILAAVAAFVSVILLALEKNFKREI